MFKEKETVKLYPHVATAFLEYKNNIEHSYEVKNNYKFYILIQKAHLYNIFLGKYSEDQELTCCFLSVDFELASKIFVNPKILENDFMISLKNILETKDFYQNFLLLIEKLKQLLSYVYIRISKENQEADSELQIAEMYTAGYPPLVLIQNESIQFPIRSGIPFGINQILPKRQTLEIPISSKVYIHTPLYEKEHNLRDLHYQIIKDNLEVVPKDLILFRYHLKGFLT